MPRMNALRTACFVLGLALFAAGCGHPDPQSLISDGQTSLAEGDAAAALGHFQEAVRGLKPTDPEYVDAKLGEAEAFISLDANKARDEFLALAEARTDRVGQAVFIDFASKLATGRRFTEAVEIVHAGIVRFGEQATRLRNQMTFVRQEAQSANDEAAIAKLRELEYIE
jgi:hypothetical protein